MSGKLIIAGGNLEFCDREIHNILVDHAAAARGKLAIVPTASGFEPVESIRYVEELWESLGVKREDMVILPVFGEEGMGWKEPAPGDDPEIVSMLEGVTGLWFTGGDQYYTHKAFIRKDLTETKALQIMKEIYRNGGIIGGTSAGAAIMSDTMIASGTNATALSKDIKYGYGDYDENEDGDEASLRIVKGLGFFTDGVVDQHYDKRPRLLRTIKAVMDSKDSFFGYGVSEDTAMIYDRDTRDITVAGSGGVYILDLRKTKQQESTYECSDVSLHIIKKGDTFNQWKH